MILFWFFMECVEPDSVPRGSDFWYFQTMILALCIAANGNSDVIMLCFIKLKSDDSPGGKFLDWKILYS